MTLIKESGFRPCNVDLIVHAETPKMSPYKKSMAESVARLIDLSPDRVGIKAKTNEGFGDIGAADAIACTAVALLVQTGSGPGS